MASTIDKIKDASQLQEYLQAQSKGAGLTKDTEVAQDYMGTLQRKKKAPATSSTADRVNAKRSQAATQKSHNVSQDIEVEDIQDPETRSVRQEIDYSRKDAARNIVKDASDKRKAVLRERLLRHMEGVRTGQAIPKSQYGSSYRSVTLRSEQTSASRAADLSSIAKAEGRLSKIAEENEAGEPKMSEEEMEIIREISSKVQ